MKVTVPELPALNVGLPVSDRALAAPLDACTTIDGVPAPVPLKVPLPLICKLPVLVMDKAPELPVALIVLLFVTLPPLRVMIVLAPDIMLLAVTLPVGVRVSVPLVDVTLPDVPMFAEPPVVVTEKLLPTVEVESVTEPALVTKAVPEPLVLADSVATCVWIGVPTEPIAPPPESRSAVVPIKVKLPDRVIVDVLAASRVKVVAKASAPMVMFDTDEILSVVPTVEVPSVIVLDSLTDARPIVPKEIVPASTINGVAREPMSPEPDSRFMVGAVREKEPVRIMAPLPLAVRLMVAAEELPVIVIEPLAAVSKSRVPVTTEVPKLTEFASLMNAEPPVLTVRVPAAVSSSVPEMPIAPEPDDRLTLVAVNVNAPLRVIVPMPLAARVIVVAELAALTEILPLEVVARLKVLPALNPEMDTLPVSVT